MLRRIRSHVQAEWLAALRLHAPKPNILLRILFARQQSGRLSGIPRHLGRISELLSLPCDPLGYGEAPAVELLVVVAGKDFSTLPLCIEAAIASSGNPIRRVTVIAPQADVDNARKITVRDSDEIPVDVVSEEAIIDGETRTLLRQVFGKRYGWVLQQFLKMAYVVESDADGVLVVDADTLLLSRRTLLDPRGIQILTPTFEMHLPYYKFLSGVGVGKELPEHTFVPHWMLMQPSILREALAATGSADCTELARTVVEQTRVGLVSDVSLDYELYAQYATRAHSERMMLTKWGNIPIARNLVDGQFAHVKSAYADYGSVSMHSYLA
jgi:hypothetical protein